MAEKKEYTKVTSDDYERMRQLCIGLFETLEMLWECMNFNEDPLLDKQLAQIAGSLNSLDGFANTLKRKVKFHLLCKERKAKEAEHKQIDLRKSSKLRLRPDDYEPRTQDNSSEDEEPEPAKEADVKLP